MMSSGKFPDPSLLANEFCCFLWVGEAEGDAGDLLFANWVRAF